MLSARNIPLLAFYVALVTVSTILFTVYVPATRGYFNIGEAAIYIIALLSGPYLGGVAGGMGSALADILLGYYLFALLFLVFDVEAVFLYPWALVIREVGIAGLVEALIFIVVLVIGLAYAWRKGVLEWV